MHSLKLPCFSTVQPMIKMPHETDFDVHVAEAAINVVFKPTESHYSYRRLADDEDHARYGRVEREPLVRHGKPGGTGQYPSGLVEAMAFRLARNSI
jgi:hypothetical protein